VFTNPNTMVFFIKIQKIPNCQDTETKLKLNHSVQKSSSESKSDTEISIKCDDTTETFSG
jgi:hypothetical protein